MYGSRVVDFSTSTRSLRDTSATFPMIWSCGSVPDHLAALQQPRQLRSEGADSHRILLRRAGQLRIRIKPFCAT